MFHEGDTFSDHYISTSKFTINSTKLQTKLQINIKQLGIRFLFYLSLKENLLKKLSRNSALLN